MNEGSACVPIMLPWLWPMPARWQLTYTLTGSHVTPTSMSPPCGLAVDTACVRAPSLAHL